MFLTGCLAQSNLTAEKPTMIIKPKPIQKITMNFKQAFLLAALPSLLSSCGVAMQRDGVQLRAQCDLRGAPGVEAVVGKIAMSPEENNNLPLRMLTLESYPSDEEKSAIMAYSEAWDSRCKPLGDAYIARYVSAPEVGAIISASQAAGRNTLAGLYLGKLTFAEANRQRQSIFVGAKDYLAKVEAAYKARDQAEAAAYSRAYLSFLASMPKQTYTHCTGGSGFTNCTTR